MELHTFKLYILTYVNFTAMKVNFVKKCTLTLLRTNFTQN